LKVFGERKKQRNEAVLKEDYSSVSIIQEDTDDMSEETLDFTLARFVAEREREMAKSILVSFACKSRIHLAIDFNFRTLLANESACTA